MQRAETRGLEEKLDDETSGSAGFSGIKKRTYYADERLAGTLRVLVYGASNQFFSDAGFAGDEHRGILFEVQRLKYSQQPNLGLCGKLADLV
jgi:hypothetical protein